VHGRLYLLLHKFTSGLPFGLAPAGAREKLWKEQKLYFPAGPKPAACYDANLRREAIIRQYTRHQLAVKWKSTAKC
jgi:hypothetical protein